MKRREFLSSAAAAAALLSVDTKLTAQPIETRRTPGQSTEKSFYFNTHASSLGGFIHEPFAAIPAQASASLPSAGGSAGNRLQDFKFGEIVACRSSYTHVAGSPVKRNGPWTTRATSVVEGLDIAGVVTADMVASRIFIEHPADGGPSKVSFAGTHFRNLRVSGSEISVGMQPSLLRISATEEDIYDEGAALTADIGWPLLADVARQQSDLLRSAEDLPDWVVERLGRGTSGALSQENPAICSVVDRIDGGASGQTFGHILDIPDFGRVFLGEVLLKARSVQLTMVRTELSGTSIGGPAGGVITVGTEMGNGIGFPP